MQFPSSSTGAVGAFLGPGRVWGGSEYWGAGVHVTSTQGRSRFISFKNVRPISQSTPLNLSVRGKAGAMLLSSLHELYAAMRQGTGSSNGMGRERVVMVAGF